MSFSTSRTSSNSPDESDHETRGAMYHSSQRREEGGNPSSNVASPIRPLPPMASPEHRPSHPLAVNNILNPAVPGNLEGSRRKSTAYFDSPRSASMLHLQSTTRSLPPSPIENPDAPEMSRLRSGSILSRHLAQPTPSSHTPRLASIAGTSVNPQSGFPPVAHRLPPYSTESHPHTPQSAVPSTGYPFPPTPTALGYQQQQPPQLQQQDQQSQSPSRPPSQTQPPPPHHQYPQHHPPSTQQRITASVSPTTSYSTYGQSGHTAAPFSHSYTNGPYGHSQQTHYNPLMALATAHGSIPVSVDTTAASKSADEKRKRNAGASARFRQRRKEREREMTQRITELEQRLKKAEEERDYYREIAMRYPQHSRQSSLSHLPSQPQNMHSHQPQHPHTLPQPVPPPPPSQTSSQPMSVDSPYMHHSQHPPHFPPTPTNLPRISSDTPTIGFGSLSREDSGIRGVGMVGTSGPAYGGGYRPEHRRQDSTSSVHKREGEGHQSERQH